MTGDSIFQEKLGQCGIQNSNVPSAFANPFSDRTAHLSTELPQSRYIYKSHINWDNYKMGRAPVDEDNVNNNNKTGNNDNNEVGNKDPEAPPDDDSDELYEIYNQN